MSELTKNSILYMPDNGRSPAGVVQIIHGMAEHQGRYRAFAQFLAANGYAVVTSDLRGHGNNIFRTAELGYFGDNAVSRLVGDIHDNTMYIKNKFPDIPYVILGHSLGTLIATVYFKKYDNFVDGLFLSGMPADRSGRTAGSIMIKLMIMLKGEYHRSKLINHMINGPFTRAFARDGSAFSWLSSDQDNVRRYEADPKCGFTFTLNGFDTMMELLDMTYTSGSWIKKNTSCPIRLLSGEDDPCKVSKAQFMKSVHLFSDNGYTNVAYVLYPGQRHEILQDSNKDIVFRDILSELRSIAKSKVQKDDVQKCSETVHVMPEDFIDPEVDKPFVKEEDLDLEELINTHKDKSAKKKNKVEVIDFKDIDEQEDVDISEISNIFTSDIDEDIEVDIDSDSAEEDQDGKKAEKANDSSDEINAEDFIDF